MGNHWHQVCPFLKFGQPNLMDRGPIRSLTADADIVKTFNYQKVTTEAEVVHSNLQRHNNNIQRQISPI